MPVFFLDSSAMVKLYRRETGTAWMKTLLKNPRSRLHVSRICNPEVTAAVVRQHKGGRLSSHEMNRALTAFHGDLSERFRIVITGPLVMTEAVRLIRQHGLRGYDGVQLASAMQVHRVRQAKGLPTLTFVSSDQELNKAATAEGMLVENPNLHGV